MENKKLRITFVESSPSAVTAKIARSLKNKGHKITLISLLNFNKQVYQEAYNEIISFDLDSFTIGLKNLVSIAKKSPNLLKNLNKIRKMKSDVIIGVANPYPLWLPALTKFFAGKIPFVFFPYDVNFLKYRNPNSYNLAGIPKFELASEKYCLENSEGLIFKGGEYEVLKKEFKLKASVLQFLPYCNRENMVKENENKLSKKDGEMHLVYVGYLETKGQGNGLGMSPSSEIIEKIIKQKIHYHVYTNSQYALIQHLKEFENLRKNKYFHLYKSVPSSELSKEISKYDFGLWLANFDFKIFKKDFVETGTGNKMTNYIEAGIPFIFYKGDLTFIYNLFKDKGLCLGIAPKELDNLKSTLKNFDYDKFKKNLPKIRKDYDLENNIPRLELFLEKLSQIKK